MRDFLTFVIMVSAMMAPALADDVQPTPMLEPAAVVKQLYFMSARDYQGSASYSIWGDGSVHFSVTLKGPAGNNVYVSGSGRTPEAALNDLRSKSDEIAATIVPQAEQTRTNALSLVESIKALLFGDRKSQ